MFFSLKRANGSNGHVIISSLGLWLVLSQFSSLELCAHHPHAPVLRSVSFHHCADTTQMWGVLAKAACGHSRKALHLLHVFSTSSYQPLQAWKSKTTVVKEVKVISHHCIWSLNRGGWPGRGLTPWAVRGSIPAVGRNWRNSEQPQLCNSLSPPGEGREWSQVLSSLWRAAVLSWTWQNLPVGMQTALAVPLLEGDSSMHCCTPQWGAVLRGVPGVDWWLKHCSTGRQHSTGLTINAALLRAARLMVSARHKSCLWRMSTCVTDRSYAACCWGQAVNWRRQSLDGLSLKKGTSSAN